jgi:hypothetical protein
MKAFKIILTSLLILLAALTLLAGLATSSLGQNYLLTLLNQKLPGTLTLENLSLSWFSPSTAQGIRLLDPKGAEVAKADEAILNTPLWRLPFTSLEGEIKNLNMIFSIDSEGLSTLEQAIFEEAAGREQGPLLSPLYLENVNVLYADRLKASGETRQENQKGHFSMKGSFGAERNLELEAENLPTLLIDQLAQMRASTPPRLFEILLGKTFSSTTQLEGDRFSQKLSSAGLDFTLNGTIQQGTLNFLPPTSLKIGFTPPQFQDLLDAFGLNGFLNLKNPLEVNVDTADFKLEDELKTPSGRLQLSFERGDFTSFQINTARIQTSFETQGRGVRFSLNAEGTELSETEALTPLIVSAEGAYHKGKADLKVNYQGSELVLKDGLFTLNHLDAPHKLKGTYTLDQLSFRGHKAKILPSTWNLDRGNVHTDFRLSSDVGTLFGSASLIPEKEALQFNLSQQHGGGSFSLTGKVESAFSPARSMALKADLAQFPSEAIAALLPPEGEATNILYSLFGYSVTGKLEANIVKMNGPFSLTLHGERCDIQTKGKITSDTLLLTEPLTASITVNKEVSTYFLDDILPLLNSALRGDKPITLTLDPQDFSVGLNPLSLKGVHLPKATLDLGKLYFSEGGKLAEILSLLNLPPNDVFSVWFTPLYFSLVDGRLNLNRVDMLIANQTPIATWGTIDFPADKVKMEVGLTGRALSQAFGSLPLPSGYMLAIPLRGPVDNPKLDKTKIAAKLSSLAAMATGPQGMLVGALIQIASGSLTDTVPEPTTQPLPWSVDAAAKEGETSEKESKPIKELQKGATQLLNRLMG